METGTLDESRDVRESVGLVMEEGWSFIPILENNLVLLLEITLSIDRFEDEYGAILTLAVVLGGECCVRPVFERDMASEFGFWPAALLSGRKMP